LKYYFILETEARSHPCGYGCGAGYGGGRCGYGCGAGYGTGYGRRRYW